MIVWLSVGHVFQSYKRTFGVYIRSGAVNGTEHVVELVHPKYETVEMGTEHRHLPCRHAKPASCKRMQKTVLGDVILILSHDGLASSRVYDGERQRCKELLLESG